MKKIIYMVMSLMLIFTSCQQGDEVFSEQSLSQEQQLEQKFKDMKPSTQEAVFSDFSEKLARAEVLCQDCEATFTLSGASGSTAKITITDSNGNVIFSQVVTTGTTYSFPINSCETYNVTTQQLTGHTSYIKVRDASSVNIIPVRKNEATYQRYSFDCPPSVDVEECTITICVNFLQGTANSVFIVVFVNGSYTGYQQLNDDGCFDLVINENDTLELKQFAINPSSDFASTLQIDASNYNLGFYMQGSFATTGIINSRYLQCD